MPNYKQVLVLLLMELLGSLSAAPTDAQGRPVIRKLGTIDCDPAEMRSLLVIEPSDV